jgi:hypothetical protein
MTKQSTIINLFFISVTLLSLLVAYAIIYEQSKRDLKEIECQSKGGVMIDCHCVKKSAVIEVSNGK